MKLKELVKKVEQINKLNDELGIKEQHKIKVYSKDLILWGEGTTLKEIYELVDYETYKEEIDSTDLIKQDDSYKFYKEFEIAGYTFKVEFIIEIW